MLSRGMGLDRTQPGTDRRAYERIPARIEVHFRERQDAARSLRAYSANFSAGGLCILTRRRYEVGARLALQLEVDGQGYTLSGAVAWVRGGAVGIRFENVSNEDRNRLNTLAQSLR